MDKNIRYFEKIGFENATETLELAKKRAIELGIKHIVVASTTGRTAVKAMEVLKGSDIKLIIVTHSFGYKKVGESSFDLTNRSRLEAEGIPILMSTMVLSSTGRQFRDALGWRDKGGMYLTIFPTDLIGDTLRMFGQGMKVCIEISVMAADAGLVPIDREIIATAGTSGADTAIVLRTAYNKNILDNRIMEIIAIPRMRIVGQ